MSQWLIYGANGYTGRLIAAAAVQQGWRPVLAGRDAAAVEKVAGNLGLPCRIFDLDDAAVAEKQLQDMRLVLHCAGPFSATSQPMIDACLTSGAHYLDISGEIAVFENAWKRSEEANRAGVVLCPGVGFDVVPTDCLAAGLVQRLPSATALTLAFESAGGMSRGTAKTSIEGLGQGGCVRKNGQLKRVPLGWKTRRIPFAHGERTAVTIPWGDVFTAWVSTGVPDIEVYLSVPAATVKTLRRLRLIRPLLRLRPVQAFLKRRVERGRAGPDADTRADTQTQLWGEAVGADGRTVSATMITPNGYDLTVSASLGVVRHLLEVDLEGGYYTPSLLLGAEFADTLPGVSVEFGEVG